MNEIRPKNNDEFSLEQAREIVNNAGCFNLLTVTMMHGQGQVDKDTGIYFHQYYEDLHVLRISILTLN